MYLLRRLLLTLILLIPLTTLVHRNDVGRWDINRSAMVAPDEVSYLLLTDNLLHGQGISTRAAIGRDTFYPPGFPLLLAGWSLIVGFSVFHAHLFNALLLCAATGMAYLLARQLLTLLAIDTHRRFRAGEAGAQADAWIALAIAALFACSWHVLEGAMFVFSEPAFMLTTFLWLHLALRWPGWPMRFGQTLLLALLAIAAWSIRGAGIVCVATMLVVPLLPLGGLFRRRRLQLSWRPVAAVLLVIALAAVYQVAIAVASPEKSLASVDSSDNSYSLQLLRGITDGGRLHFAHPAEWPALLLHLLSLSLSHLDDFANSFTPWTREWMEPALLPSIGKLVGGLCLLGWVYRLTRGSPAGSRTRFVEIYLFFYTALYLAWPFNMSRFWAPLLPVMLVYGGDALREFTAYRGLLTARRVAVVLFFLLWMVAAEELVLQLGNYGRRLNYVSDALAAAAATVVHRSPDPQATLIDVAGSSEHFLFAWYLPRGSGYLPRSPQPHRESPEDLILRSISELDANPQRKLFIISYFTEPRYSEVFDNLRRRAPEVMAAHRIERVYEKEIVTTVWQVTQRPIIKKAQP